MIVLSVEINCLRGIKNLKLDFNGKNAVIYGDNGTGKSGVIDALDFLIKGDITRLNGNGSKNLTLDKHGKYVTESIDNAWVKATVKLPNHAESIEIKRFLNNPSELICDEQYKSDFDQIRKLANLQAHYLSRREILQVINSTDKERADTIEKLLNLSSLEKNRTILQKVKRTFDEKLKLGKANEDTYIKEISKGLGMDQASWLDAINGIRAQLGGYPICALEKDAIVKDISLDETAAPKAEVNNLIQTIDNLYKAFCSGTDCLINKIKETDFVYEKMCLLQEFKEKVDYLVLYQGGKKLIKDDICPLCEQPIESKESLARSLQEKIDKLTETKDVLDKYQHAIKELNECLVAIRSLSSSIDLNKLSKYINITKMQDVFADTDAFYDSVINNKYSTNLSQAFLGRKYEECIKTYYLDELMKISVQMSLDQKDNNYKCLVDINAKYNLLCDLQNENVILMRNAQRAKVLFDSYVDAQTETLNEMYDSIQDRFSELYKIIHSSDESSFSGELNRKAAALELRVQFKDGNMYPPNAVHSEGHQDSMGICLFFALSEKISNSKLNLVLLDDVVMSIDIDHRKNFCKLIKEQFPNKQFIITTHDYIWRKELESLGVVQKKNVIHFKAWDIDHGPYVEVGSNIWDTINKYLAEGNKSEAIGLMRYYMEEFFASICEKYLLKVPYSTSGRWSLEQVLAPVNSFYRNAISKANLSATSYKKTIEEIKKIQDYENAYTKAYNDLQVDRWMINPGTHFTTWAQGFSIDELKSLCESVKNFCDIFECPVCKGLITIVPDNNLVPQRIFCNCGKFAFSCIPKKKE